MNGRREPILGGRASRAAQGLGAGPHHGAGGRHAGDASPGATHPPLGACESVLANVFLSPLPFPPSSPPLLHLLFFLFPFFPLEFSEFSQFSGGLSFLLPPFLSLHLSQTFSFLVPTFLYFLSSCLLFSFLSLAFSLVSLRGSLASSPFPASPVPRSLWVVASLPAYPLMLFHTPNTSRNALSRFAAAAQPEFIKN